MTLTERVLWHMEETRGEWELLPPFNVIRQKGKNLCPLASACETFLSAEARGIILAADDGSGHAPSLRAAMLEAAGLAEAAT